jgi:signal transduction histidine kinase/phage shock protein PspC (stress-responsive transcriptional regulator)
MPTSQAESRDVAAAALHPAAAQMGPPRAQTPGEPGPWGGAVSGGGTPVRRLVRDPANRIVAGVAAGLAAHLRLPVLAVRIAFVGLISANGVGALLYVAFWAVLPAVPQGPARPRARGDGLQAAGLVALAAGIVVLRFQLGLGVDSTVVGFVALAALGAGIVWHQAEPQRRADPQRHRRSAQPELADPALADPALAAVAPITEARRWFPLRLVGGGLLIIVGIIGLTGLLAPLSSTGLNATLTGLIFALLALVGVTVAVAPLLYRVFGQLRDERVARIREQERAEVAAVVHDQVLHTLALIQRNAGNATSVVRLARGQERSLRNWLYKPMGSPTDRFAAALEQVAAEIEDTYAMTVETVVVSDVDQDEGVSALVAATREALVNSARHANVGVVSLYAEVEADVISVYVRDRGTGFDLSTVDDDRHGLRGSIIGRMRRHGGRAVVRTAPGEGTEVELTMPRTGTTLAGAGEEAGRRDRKEAS